MQTNRKKNCSNMSIHCAVLWPDEHLKCKCSNYATTLVTLVAQQYVYNKYLCSLSPFMVSYPLPKSPLNHNGVKAFLKPHSEFLVICDFTRIWRDSFKTCNLDWITRIEISRETPKQKISATSGWLWPHYASNKRPA